MNSPHQDHRSWRDRRNRSRSADERSSTKRCAARSGSAHLRPAHARRRHPLAKPTSGPSSATCSRSCRRRRRSESSSLQPQTFSGSPTINAAAPSPRHWSGRNWSISRVCAPNWPWMRSSRAYLHTPPATWSKIPALGFALCTKRERQPFGGRDHPGAFGLEPVGAVPLGDQPLRSRETQRRRLFEQPRAVRLGDDVVRFESHGEVPR